MPLLAYANVVGSSGYAEDHLSLDFFNRNDQPNAIKQINIKAEQELEEFEAPVQKGRIAVINKRNAQIIRVKLIYENAIFAKNDAHKNMYPPAKEFITLIESEVGIIHFIKDPEISGPALKTAFTVIKVTAYVCILPYIKEKGIRLIEDYLRQVPVVGPLLSTSLNLGLWIINLPNTFAKWA